MQSNMKRLVVMLAITMSWTGCSGDRNPPPLADSEQAAETLKSTLESWKSGDRPESLFNQQPKVHVVDDDWQAGQQLVSYQLLDVDKSTLAIDGVAARIPAVLEILGPMGNRRKVVDYMVRTSPSRSVVRFDNEPDPADLVE